MGFLDGVRFALGGSPEEIALGGATEADAARLVDVQRAAGDAAPHGCAWLDETTISDLELPSVARAIDRTVTPIGAQQLWRMLCAPAVDPAVLDAREAAIGELTAAPQTHPALRDALARGADADAAYVPLLLWGPRPAIGSPWLFRGLALALLGSIAGMVFVHALLLPAFALLVYNVLLDDRTNTRLGGQVRALASLGQALRAGQRVVDRGLGPADERAGIAADLPVLARFRRRIAASQLRDPFELLSLIQAVFLVRIIALAAAVDELERQRAALRRVHERLGRIDALLSIATLRRQRADATVPILAAGPAQLDARGLVHPAIDGAVGNDLALDGQGLVITGSNMAGKSTFLRALGLGAVLAQSIHTVFGTWRGSVFRIAAAMRARDDTASGTSTYAAEVAAIGGIIAEADAARAAGVPLLAVLDEPFRGTNPTARVPIVVGVLEYLGDAGLCAAATHDLDVAAQLSPRFLRVFFRDPGDAGGGYRLHAGTAPTTNAVALLRRAGYPEALVASIEAATAAVSSRRTP
ncbi:MAG TPA: hypothetical protein VGM88_02435 [Kofleriaceae bacterium]|jgi:hypothetical protein